jgi:hypothetical protein
MKKRKVHYDYDKIVSGDRIELKVYPFLGTAIKKSGNKWLLDGFGNIDYVMEKKAFYRVIGDFSDTPVNLD